MDPSMLFVIRVILIWLLCLLSVLLHELGHAAGYRISGGKAEWKIGAGSGPKMFSTTRLTFRLIPVGGYYYVPDEETKSSREKIIMFAGGPVVSLLLTALFGVLCYCVFRFVQPESTLCEILYPTFKFVLFFNFFQFLFTVIPIRYRVVCRGFESDGLQILHALKQNKAPH